MNTRAYYKLTQKRNEIEEKLESYNDEVKAIREQAKKLKKGSLERESTMMKANTILNSKEYIKLKAELDTLNLCINIVYYN